MISPNRVADNTAKPVSTRRASVVRGSENTAHGRHCADDIADSDNQVQFDPDMKSQIFTKIQRAKSVILDGQHLFLKECAKCGGDFYGREKQTHCNECAGKRRTRAS
jgi:hypothetical protein